MPKSTTRDGLYGFTITTRFHKTLLIGSKSRIMLRSSITRSLKPKLQTHCGVLKTFLSKMPQSFHAMRIQGLQIEKLNWSMNGYNQQKIFTLSETTNITWFQY